MKSSIINELLSYNTDELIALFKNSKERKKKFPGVQFNFNDSSLYLYFEEYTYIIFLKEIKINIINKETELSQKVRTNIQIKRFLEKYGIDINKVIILENENKNKFKDCFDYIDLYIDNDIINLKVEAKEIPNFIFIEECITLNSNDNPEKYSKFFYDYFPHIKKLKQNEEFKFYNNEQRKKIIINFNQLRTKKEIHNYKITGPFSTGKSITLFKISLAYLDTIYINLKTLKANKDNLYKCLEIIFSACSRVFFEPSQKDKFREQLEKIDLCQNILQILLEILNLIISITKKNIILILDQFKLDNINNDNSFIYSIKQMNKNKLKVIYCSSINDNDMRDELIKTFIKYKGNPNSGLLSVDNQDYYFYYTDLYLTKKEKSLTYKLFRNKYNYSKLFDEKNIKSSIKKINEKIDSKLSTFKTYSYEKQITNNNYSLSDILLFMKNVLYHEQSMSQFLDIISICPFKYFIIDIDMNNNKFMVIPIFPYMIYYINDYIKDKDCEEYFSKEKYKIFGFLTNKVKGEYFKFTVKKGIKEILKFPEVIKDEVHVDQISEMNKIADDYDELLSGIKDNEEEEGEKGQEENEEEEKESEKDVGKDEEDLEEYNIINQNLNEKIDEKVIKNKIKKYYEKKYEKFDIFQEKKNKENKIKEKASEIGVIINEMETNELKELDDYRKEEFDNRITEIKNKIIKDLNQRKSNNREKMEVKIKIEKNINIRKNIKYSGNENFFIEQINKNGKTVDYAVLYGDRKDKTFITFKMKCYSDQTSLSEKINKKYIKSKLSPMLINSLQLFNCKITRWHYFLIFYFNEKDTTTNNLGTKQLISSLNSDIQYILYNPLTKEFSFPNSNNTYKKIINLELTEKSNLDYSLYLNNRANYCFFEPVFKKINNRKELISSFWVGFQNFINDISIYNNIDKGKNSIQYLCEKFKVLNIFYSLSFHDNIINKPNDNKIFLYKKKNSSHFIGIKNNVNKITYYDLENNGKELTNYNDLIDLDYQFVYILEYSNTKKRTEPTNNLDDFKNFDSFINNISEKEKIF